MAKAKIRAFLNFLTKIFAHFDKQDFHIYKAKVAIGFQ
jgi:hypothetical protein